MSSSVATRAPEKAKEETSLVERSSTPTTSPPVGDNGERLTPEQVREVRQLIREGMSPEYARRAVLGDDA